MRDDADVLGPRGGRLASAEGSASRWLAALVALFAACKREPASVTSPALVDEMVRIPAGAFVMGCSHGRCDTLRSDVPPHEVWLPAFEIDVTEVTRRSYFACIEAGACSPPGVPLDPRAEPALPVTGVTWEQARGYCAHRGKRLPTEAEWEKAARGTDGRRFPWGGEPPDCLRAQLEGCGGAPAPVGLHPSGASPYGVQDMAGNVQEWVADWFEISYYGRSPRQAPRGPDAPTGSGHVVRGGSFRYDAWHLAATVRFWDPGAPTDDLGFRCAR